MLRKLLINLPSGEQVLTEIDATGSYFDQSAIAWDELIDGPMPEVTLGKMQRVGNNLVMLTDFIPAHREAVYRRTFPVEVPMAAASEALINAGLYDAVDAYIKTLDPVSKVWWDRSDKINIAFPLVETVRNALGWTRPQLEALFLEAEQIRKQRAGEV